MVISIFILKRAFKHGIKDIDKRRKLGLNAEILNIDELKKLEPNLIYLKGEPLSFQMELI